MTPRKMLMAAYEEDVEYEWKWEEGIEIVNIFIRCPPWHTNGDNVGLSLDRVFQFEDRDVILKGRRLVVLVDHHAFHLNKNISVQIRPGRRNDWSSQSFASIVDTGSCFYLHLFGGHHLIGPGDVVLAHLHQ